jgi:pimeloyl-ACP methyl ester carboxylesterase
MEPYPFEKKQIELDSGTVTYVTVGDPSRPPLLFLHNGGGDHRCWAHQLQSLHSEFYCVAIDLPGFGESSRVDTVYTVEWLADQVLAFIKAYFSRTHPPVAISVVGHCIGAATALEMATRSPETFSKISLVNICAGQPGMGSAVRSFYRWMPKNRTVLSVLFQVFGFVFQSRVLQQTSLRQLFRIPDPEKNPCVFYEAHVSAKKNQFINRQNLIAGMKSFEKYAHKFDRSLLTHPIQVIWGRHNEVMTPEFGQKLSQYLKAPLYWMESSKHMPMSEQPQEFNELLIRFHKS